MSESNSATIIAAVILGVFGVIASWLGHKIDKTHELVNHRMDELLDLTRKSSLAEGIKEQKQRSTDEAVRVAGSKNQV